MGEETKKAKSGYNPYDQEEIDQETGEIRRKGMLDKYNDGIDGETATKKSFVISSQGTFSEEEQRERARAKIREKLASHTVETLETTQMKVASDYYTEEEVVKFKKPKKKKKVKRKMLKLMTCLVSMRTILLLVLMLKGNLLTEVLKA